MKVLASYNDFGIWCIPLFFTFSPVHAPVKNGEKPVSWASLQIILGKQYCHLTTYQLIKQWIETFCRMPYVARRLFQNVNEY